MKRALRLIYGRDNVDTSAEGVHLLSTTERKPRSKTSYSQLCNQAMESLVLLACKESSVDLETSVKFSTNHFVPISFFCSLVQLLDADSVRNLCRTSKSFHIAITSQEMNKEMPHIPYYCIDTVKVSENIQHLEKANGILLASDASSSHGLLNKNTRSSLADDDHNSGTESEHYSFNQIQNFWFLIAAGSTFLFFILCLQYLHIYKLSVYIIGFLITVFVCYLHNRQRVVPNINDATQFGYEAI